MAILPLTLVLLAASAPPPAAGPGRTEQVAAGVVAAQTRLERLLVDYDLDVRHNDGPPIRNRFAEAYAGELRFLEAVHTGGSSPSLPPWLDVWRNRSWSRPDGVTIYSLFDRKAHAHRTNPEFLRDSHYTTCLGWRTGGPGGRRLVDGRPYFLLDLLGPGRDPGVTARPERESVDGLSCEVVMADGGRDQVWVCPDRGYAVVKRVFKRNTKGGADIDVRCGDFTEVAPGLWLPKTCSGEYRWANPDHKTGFEVRVAHLAVNEGVGDSQFQPHLAPGTVVLDEHEKVIAALPGGTDLFDLWAAVLMVDFPPTPDQPWPPVPAGCYGLTLLGFALAACGVVLLRAARRPPEPLVEAVAPGGSGQAHEVGR